MLPTVITDVKDDSTLMQDEIFGPVVCIVSFDTEEEVQVLYNNYEIAMKTVFYSFSRLK